MHSKKVLDERLLAAGIQPLKKLGQNFLVNGPICTRIVEEAKKNNPRSIVEIGPGLGALTDELLAQEASAATEFTMVEYDSGLVEFWNKIKKEKNLNFQVIHQDALRVDWKKIGLKEPATLVSNLPYSIAASLVMELSPLHVFQDMVLMFQKEVAERIMAPPQSEDYGMLSVVGQSFWQVQKLVDAGPQDFFPVPNVGSRVLSFSRRIEGLPKEPEKFIVFVKAAFAQRRKKMISNLGGLFEKNTLLAEFEKRKLPETIRAQELSPKQFQDLYEGLAFQAGS